MVDAIYDYSKEDIDELEDSVDTYRCDVDRLEEYRKIMATQKKEIKKLKIQLEIKIMSDSLDIDED